jgi:hypothetical protein
VGKHRGERPRDRVEIERVDDQHPVFQLAVPEEPAELCLKRLLPMGRLFLVSAERAQLPLRFEQFLHRRGTQCARQLVLQVGVARIEAEPLEIGAREARAEAGSSESPPEVALFGGVVEACETETQPRGPVALEEAAEVPVAAYRRDRHALRIEVVALSPCEGLDGCAVALSFHEHD